MMQTDDLRVRFTKSTDIIIKIAGIVGAITIIAGGYSWYINNIWKPKITLIKVDFENGIALVKYMGKELVIEGDAIYLLGGDWGIKFGNIRKNGSIYYDRLELVKRGMVYEYLSRNNNAK